MAHAEEVKNHKGNAEVLLSSPFNSVKGSKQSQECSSEQPTEEGQMIDQEKNICCVLQHEEAGYIMFGPSFVEIYVGKDES